MTDNYISIAALNLQPSKQHLRIQNGAEMSVMLRTDQFLTSHSYWR